MLIAVARYELVQYCCTKCRRRPTRPPPPPPPAGPARARPRESTVYAALVHVYTCKQHVLQALRAR
jgi:hypothetical protein